MAYNYCYSTTEYRRLLTREVHVGGLAIGNGHPVRIQTMTTTDTMDVAATVAQSIRCIEAGAELVRITAPSKKEAEQLALIRKELQRQGYHTPLVADIHFTPNAAEIAARIVEKVRINPGNYIDKKKFDTLHYTAAEYEAEIHRIRDRFLPLVRICKEHGTAMRIGTNHGSLSDRIMSHFGDTPIGMVESALEFLRIARDENYHQIVLSMKSSNPLVMVQAYRLLVSRMMDEFGECYPLHLGVTEAGDGEDGRIKSAIGIGSLLEDGLGDTIRVSLTEDPEFEIPVCQDLVRRYAERPQEPALPGKTDAQPAGYDPMHYRRRATSQPGHRIGSASVPVVVADKSTQAVTEAAQLAGIGYRYDAALDKWNIGDAAADFLYANGTLPFDVPGTLHSIRSDDSGDLGLTQLGDPVSGASQDRILSGSAGQLLERYGSFDHAAFAAYCVGLDGAYPVQSARKLLRAMHESGDQTPVIWKIDSAEPTADRQLIQFAAEAGALLLDGFGDGLWLTGSRQPDDIRTQGRTYLPVGDYGQFLNNTAFSILQATRTRISKTEYISCPSCGRTLFDLQETTAKIRAATSHLKGVKLAIMGCIVNGPGEMADADFGYVGSGPGKISLYKGKEVVKKNVSSDTAVDELIALLRDHSVWVDPPEL